MEVLISSKCESCVFGQKGYYNPMCAHCPSCSYSKYPTTRWMSKETALMHGIVKDDKSVIEEK